jgi:hypothetical protein
MRPLAVSSEEIRWQGCQTCRLLTGNGRKYRPKNGASEIGGRAIFRTPNQAKKTQSHRAGQKNFPSPYLPTNAPQFKPQLRANYTNKPRLHTLQSAPYPLPITLGSASDNPALRPWPAGLEIPTAARPRRPLYGPKVPHKSPRKTA